MFKYSILFAVLATTILCSCDSRTLEKRLEDHVYFLASDHMFGRETGTKYEKNAAAYIQEEFRNIGLKPLGENETYFQNYRFLANKTLGKNNRLNINGIELEIEKDFFPLSFSSTSEIEGNTIYKGIGVHVNDAETTFQNEYKSFLNGVFLIKIEKSDMINSVRDWRVFDDLRDMTLVAEEQGATAVIFYSNEAFLIDSRASFREKISAVHIPVVFVTNSNLIHPESYQYVSLQVHLNEEWRTGRNVIGFIDHGSKKTIIVAGHHDGIGYSQNSDQNDRKDKPVIYNGADDGVSGISVLIEFARWIKHHDFNKNNYLFISFSGEEMKLLGSMYYTAHPTIDLNQVKCMISLDHIGRLDPTEKTITIYGVGTSPGWEAILKGVKVNGVSMLTYEAGLGLTDYTPFYLNHIPILGFNTKVHDDFHGPSDVAEKINYKGMEKMFNILIQIDSALAQTENLEFSSTHEIDPSEILKYISRNIDYSFEGRLN